MWFVFYRKSRKTVDTTETMKQFGPVEIHYGKVQQKVNLKYDSWHREILSRFGSLLGENMHDFHSTVTKASCSLATQWDPSNQGGNEPEESVLVSEVSSFQRLSNSGYWGGK